MLYHVSSGMSIQLFDTRTLVKVVDKQKPPSVYFYVYVYGRPPYGPRSPALDYYISKVFCFLWLYSYIFYCFFFPGPAFIF